MLPVFRILLLQRSFSNSPPSSHPDTHSNSRISHFPWHRLPLELGIMILWYTYKSGDMSPHQHGSLCKYAASPATLPSPNSFASLDMKRGIVKRVFHACEIAEFLSLVGCEHYERGQERETGYDSPPIPNSPSPPKPSCSPTSPSPTRSHSSY